MQIRIVCIIINLYLKLVSNARCRMLTGLDPNDTRIKGLVKMLNRRLMQQQAEWQAQLSDERERAHGAELRVLRAHNDELDRLAAEHAEQLDALRHGYEERIEQLEERLASAVQLQLQLLVPALIHICIYSYFVLVFACAISSYLFNLIIKSKYVSIRLNLLKKVLTIMQH